MGTPLYADARLYGEAGVPTVMYGAGPRTVLESNAKRADENVLLEDLRRATKVIARTLLDLLGGSPRTELGRRLVTLRRWIHWRHHPNSRGTPQCNREPLPVSA